MSPWFVYFNSMRIVWHFFWDQKMKQYAQILSIMEIPILIAAITS